MGLGAEVPSAPSMTRPLRLEYPGSLWHITVRGNEKRPTFVGDRDRHRFLDLLGETVRRFGWVLTAYVLMSNHYHLVVELTDNTLSRGMKWLNGSYTQWFNHAHDRVGHLFQGRFKSFLIDKETYFREVVRYVVLNPVRAKMVARPEDYEWSSYRATIGQSVAPSWLAVDAALICFGNDLRTARVQYQRFVDDGVGSSRRPWDDLVGQIYLGSDSWIEKVRQRIEEKARSNDHPSSQRELLRPGMEAVLSAISQVMDVPQDRIRNGRGGTLRSLAAWLGCYEGRLTNCEIAAALRLRSDRRVTTLIADCNLELQRSAMLREGVDRCVTTLRRKNCELQT